LFNIRTNIEDMAGVATLSAGTVLLLAFLLLSIITLIWWFNLGGKEAFAKIIYAVGDGLSWLCTTVGDWWSNTAYPWITDVAVPTATDVWNETIDYVDEKALEVSKAIDKALEDAKDKTLKKTTGVYEIYVVRPGTYNNYFFGGFRLKIKIPEQTEGSTTYKYGTTTMATITSRYPMSGSGRKGYIGYHLYNNNFSSKFFFVGPTMINPKNWNKFEATALEKQLLLAYCLSHYGYFPPGNTKFG